jgi:hypothetical protein
VRRQSKKSLKNQDIFHLEEVCRSAHAAPLQFIFFASKNSHGAQEEANQRALRKKKNVRGERCGLDMWMQPIDSFYSYF